MPFTIYSLEGEGADRIKNSFAELTLGVLRSTKFRSLAGISKYLIYLCSSEGFLTIEHEYVHFIIVR